MLTCDCIVDRPRHHSMFTGRWKRKDGELEEDEWFIPYNRRSAPIPTSVSKGGIGEMPLSSGSGSGSGSGPGFRPLFATSSGIGHGHGHRTTHYRQKSAEPNLNPNGDSTGRRFFPLRPRLPRSGSDGSLTRPPGPSERLPSNTSVPTGLVAPKMLFSPISREIRQEHSGMDTAPPIVIPESRPMHGLDNPRSTIPAQPHSRARAVSMPKSHGRAHASTSHMYDSVDPSRWAAPTMCDLLVFPRPHITAHTITPPASPEKVSSMFDGLSMAEKVDREKERDEWHRYAQKTARSKSFRVGAMPGHKARAEDSQAVDAEGNADLSRRGTATSRLVAKIRSRSASVGNSNPSRKSSRAKSEKKKAGGSRGEEAGHQGENRHSETPMTTTFGHKERSSNGHEDLDDDPFRHSQVTEAERYRRTHHQNQHRQHYSPETNRHHHSKSSPDLMSMVTRSQGRRAPLPPSPDQGVIVIGPGASVRSPPSSGQHLFDSRSPTRPDFTKPLPPLPAEYRLQYNPSSPFKPFDANAGREASPARLLSSAHFKTNFRDSDDPFLVPSSPASSSKVADVSTSTPLSQADARALIARQHQRVLTKRAFHSPRPVQTRDSANTSGPVPSGASATSSSYSQSSRRTSAMSAVSPLRRLTAMEEAIGRSRAASVGTHPAPARTSSLRESERAGSQMSGSAASPARPVNGTLLVTGSDQPSTQTTPRMRTISADSQTPSPRNPHHEDFKVCQGFIEVGKY